MSLVAGKAVRVPIGSLHLNIRVDGPEGAPWMVFSNSLATNISLWDEQAEALKSRFRILRYDQRGHGKSDVPRKGTDFDGLTDDLIGLLDHCGIDKAILVGVSMGAVTVLRCAARAPQRCRAVIACDGQWRSPAGARETWVERINVARGQGMAALAKPTATRWTCPDFFTRLPETAARVERMVADTPAEGFVACADALQDYDFSKDFPGLSVPVLYLVGRQDGAMPEIMKEMAAATPGSVYRAIDHCGHLPNIEQPEAFMRAVNEFVAKV